MRWRLSGYGGQEIYETAKWQMPQTPATNTHTYTSIMQIPQWKIFLWHLWRRTHFRWQTSWTNRVVPNWPSKNGFKFTRQPEMGTGQGRTGGGEGGAQQQLSRNDVECVCVCVWGAGGRRHEIHGLLKSKLKTRLLSLALIEQAI